LQQRQLREGRTPPEQRCC